MKVQSQCAPLIPLAALQRCSAAVCNDDIPRTQAAAGCRSGSSDAGIHNCLHPRISVYCCISVSPDLGWMVTVTDELHRCWASTALNFIAHLNHLKVLLKQFSNTYTANTLLGWGRGRDVHSSPLKSVACYGFQWGEYTDLFL